MGMVYLLQIALFIGLLYWIGAAINAGRSANHGVHFLKVAVSFCVMLATSACSLVLALIVSLGFEQGIESITQTQKITSEGRLDSAGFFLFIFITIFLSGILQFYIRRFMTTHRLIWRLNTDDIEIAEYLVQWSTILLAIYQFVFENIRNVMNVAEDIDSTHELLEFIFSPEHLNLGLLPVLMTTWIAIVIEKLRTRRDRAAVPVAHDGQP